MTDIRNEVRAFVVKQFLFGEAGGLVDTGSLLEQGVVDSTGILELVAFIEATYGVKIADDELVPDNLDSIERIVGFVQRKLQAPAVSSGA